MLPSIASDPDLGLLAAGARPDAAGLRDAYLRLLKLSLCDLTGVVTREVRWTEDRRVFSRALTDNRQLRDRAEGKDWPLDGLTMVGLRRLDDLQACVESIVGEGVPGDLIEAGAWRGGASILIRATLDTLGATDRQLWVADSFQGFPLPEDQNSEADRRLESEMSRIGFLAPSLESVRQSFARFGVTEGVSFLPGFFEQTMTSLRGRRWSLVRLDADTYRATRVVLRALYPGLAQRGYVVVDDYFHPYLPESCRKAVDEFRAEHGITEPIEQIDWNGARWRKATLPLSESDAGGLLANPEAVRPRPAAEVPGDIPTDRELQLQDQLGALRAALDAVPPRRPGLAASPAARLLSRAWSGGRSR
jgi:hypothetical protein